MGPVHKRKVQKNPQHAQRANNDTERLLMDTHLRPHAVSDPKRSPMTCSFASLFPLSLYQRTSAFAQGLIGLVARDSF